MNAIFAFGLGLLIGIFAVSSIWYFEARMARQAEKKSRAAYESDIESRVNAILDVLPESYIIVNYDFTIYRASSLASFFGFLDSEGILQPRLAELAGEVFATHAEKEVEFDITRRMSSEHTERRIWMRISPISADKVVFLFEDQTEKKRLDQTRRDFVANVSHELKTPVGAIGLLAETLGEVSQEPENVEKFAARLLQESKRLGELVQEIIQLSRLQEGIGIIEPKLVSVDGIIEEALERTKSLAAERGITLVWGGEKGLEVMGDFALLMTAVRNLVDNAVRYSHPAGRVSVGVSAAEGRVAIAVIDAGAGISPEQQEHVFERFYRGDQARSRDNGGTGLGLSIVKHVIADHGGEIKLWSEKGKGSTFTILLPQAKRNSVERAEA